uniref:Leucine-rich repeat-containing N-terminal plant-type domain-containing protein n=1 Tax=Kalanchoe fedtschenkoi TaxID=63787 RepID=A0A7N0V610_KALFE
MARQLFCSNPAYFLLPILLFSSAHALTDDVDIEVLRSLKDRIDPNSIPPLSFLETWNFQVDPCESGGGNFLGVLCTQREENVSSRVTEIDLDGVGYDGFLTQQIGNLTELTVLSLGNNLFRGPIPDSVSKLEKLTILATPGNYFTGTFPEQFGKLKPLQVLDFSHNRLSGPIPPTISEFRSLTILRLSGNAFTGNIPNLHGLWKLSTLDLSSNMLYGPLPRLPVNLKELVLSHNTLSGHIAPIQNLVKLDTLDLSDNRFSGAIQQGILALPKSMVRSWRLHGRACTWTVTIWWATCRHSSPM